MPKDTASRGSAASSASSSTTSTKAPAVRRESDIREEIGVAEQERRAIAARDTTEARRTPNPVPGHPDIISGESVAQMRARVATERAESEPTEFQRSLIGRDVGAAGTTAATAANVTATGGAAGATGTAGTAGAGTTGTTGATGAGGTGTTGV